MNQDRRDFLKSMAMLPFLGYFAFAFKKNILRTKSSVDKKNNTLEILAIDKLEAPEEKLTPPTGNTENVLRFGLVGNGWRGSGFSRYSDIFIPMW